VVQQYLLRFQKLKVATVAGMPAPHKPLLLLAIIDLIEQGIICENRITISPELVARFKDLFSLLADERFTPNFALPFYHLQSERFWKLRTHTGMEIALTSSRSIRSFGQLREVVAHGYFDNARWELLSQESSRHVLTATLLQRYLPNRKKLSLRQRITRCMFKL
jgi:putative restriction endonuclease